MVQLKKEDFMNNTRNNSFIVDDFCHCHYQNKRIHKNQKHCCQFWFDDDFHCHSCCNSNCPCHKKDCFCPRPKPPQPKPEKVCDCKGVGIQAVLKDTEAEIIEAGDNVKFDTVLHHIGRDIIYNEKTGEFTIKKPGDYKISWQIIVGGSHAKRFINFGIKLNGKLYHGFPLPITTGLLTSDVILTTKKPNAIVSLFNNTEDKVRLSRHMPNANLVITNV